MAVDPNVQQLSQELQRLSQALREMVSSSSRTLSAQQANNDLYIAVGDQLELFEESLDRSNSMSKEEIALYKVVMDLKKREIEATVKLTKARRDYQTLSEKEGTTAQQLTLARSKLTIAEREHTTAVKHTSTALSKYKSAMEDASNSMGGLARSGTLAGAALAWFGSTVKAQINQQIAQIKASGGVIEATGGIEKALLDQQTLALKYQLAGDEIMTITAKNRQLFNSMGGTERGLAELGGTIDHLAIMTGGDFARAMELAANSAEALARSGIKPTSAALKRYTDDVDQLTAQTGMQREAAQSLYDGLSQEVEMIDILRSARSGEREAILASQRAMLQQAIAVGMTTEQAKQAASMLNKMVAAKPLDRLKQAARVRALAGAMGISGGDEAAQAIIAGKRATEQQRANLMQFNQNAANALDQSAGQGLGAEIFATTLADKLQLDQHFGQGSPFSTSIDSLRAPLNEISAHFKTVASDPMANTVLEIAKLVKQAEKIASGEHFSGPIVAGLAAAGSLLAQFLVKGGLALGGGAAGAAGAAAAGTAGAAGAAGVAGAAVTRGSRLAAAGKLAAGGAVMGAITYGADALAGSLGAGGHQLDDQQDEANWRRMSTLQKVESGIGRSIEKLGGFLFMDNLANEARSKRMIAETSYLDANTSVPSQLQPTSKALATNDVAEKTAETSKGILSATMQTSNTLTTQLKKMDDSTDVLRKIQTTSEKHTELLEKQLAALMLTETERATPTVAPELRGSRFNSQYNYV